MASTYTVNLGIEKIGTGEQSGTWGTTTNTNFDLIDEAVNGVITVTLSSAGSSGSPNSLVVTNGASSNGRNKFIEFADGGDLGGTAFVQLTPNDAEKIVHVRNSLSGSRSVIIFQGTYNASNDFEIPNGKDVVLKFNGGGSGATVTDVFADLQPTALTTATLTATTADINGGTIDGVTIGGASAGAGSFTTLTASDDVNFDSGTLFVDASADSVGIGTTSPQAKLDVSGVGNFSTVYNTFSGDGLHIQCSGTAGDGNYAGGISFSRISSDNDSRAAGISGVQTESDADRVGLAFFTHNSNTTSAALVEAMRIDSDGKVGINTTSPGGRLSVRGTSGLGISDSHLDFGTNQDAYITTGASGIVVFREHDGSSTNTERARIDADGNVGIGTTTINEKLVLGSADSGSNFLQVTNSTTTAADNRGLYVGIDANEAARILNRENTDLIFSTNNTTRMTLDNSGNLGIGTTSPSSVLHLSTSNDPIITLTDTGAGASADITGSNGNLRLNSQTATIFDMADSEVGRIDSSGNFLVATTNNSPVGANVVGVGLFPNGSGQFSRDGGIPLFVNRKSSDGDLLSFRKDGTEAGVIGSKNGDLVLGTEACGMRFIDGDPSISPVTTNGGTLNDNAIDLGRSTSRFKDIYRAGSTISTSDRNAKQDERPLTEAEATVAQACKGLLKAFRFIDDVETDGDGARIHFGIIAQDLQAAFEAEGLDANRYAMFRPSTFTNDEGNEETRLGVCYENLLAFIIAAL